MSKRSLYLLGAGIGGTAGGFVPGIWGGSDFSGWAILLSVAGGFAGLWAAYKLSQWYS
jgi:hypothetical protein